MVWDNISFCAGYYTFVNWFDADTREYLFTDMWVGPSGDKVCTQMTVPELLLEVYFG